MKRLKVFIGISCLFFGLAASSQAEVDWQSKALIAPHSAILAMAPTFDGKKIFVLTKGTLTIYDAKGKKIDSIPVADNMDQLNIAGFQPAGIPEKIFLSASQSGQITEISYSMVIPIDATDSPFLGNANAPVMLAVFSDFQ